LCRCWIGTNWTLNDLVFFARGGGEGLSEIGKGWIGIRWSPKPGCSEVCCVGVHSEVGVKTLLAKVPTFFVSPVAMKAK